MTDELGGKIMKEFVGLRAKTYSYFIGNDSEEKNAKGAKNCVIKRKLKFDNYKNCLEAAQLENKINQREKNKVNVDSFKESHKEFIKNNKLILKTQQRFKSEKHNFVPEEVNKITLSANDDKIIQSIDSVETYAYGTRKDLICKKEELKCNNIIKND